MQLHARTGFLLNDLVSLVSPDVCRSCGLRASLRIIKTLRNGHGPRAASTIASSTAINAPTNVPRAFQDLHRTLDRLKKVAPNYVNLSRLQLALRGLESTTPVTRIAILGIQNQKSARRLTRLLLADALGEEGGWERSLEESAETDGRGLLLRYGDETDPQPTNALVSTIHVPSRILKLHNLEILLSIINLPGQSTSEFDSHALLNDAALVPTAETQKSFSGSVQFITYPVHRALIVSEGLPGLLALGRYIKPGDSATQGSSLVKFVVQFPSSSAIPKSANSTSEVAVLDIDVARDALAKFRESTANALTYEQNWFKSGLPSVTTWFSPKSEESDDEPMAPAVSSLIDDVLTSAVKIIETERAKIPTVTEPAIISDSIRQSLAAALQVWTNRAHTELRNELDQGFASDKWTKLKWWKLIWRVDDVTMISEELVRRCWLIDAEKGIIWLAGRAVQAGVYDGEDAMLQEWPGSSPATDTTTDPVLVPTSSTASVYSTSPLSPTAPVAAAAAADGATILTTPIPSTVSTRLPWPTTIPLARNKLLTTTIPPLQTLAQSLLLQTLSLTSVSTALSALLYISIPTTSLYSVGAVAALGLVWGLRRMQRMWERARGEWEGEVRESGRVVLKDLQAGFAEVIEGARRIEERKGLEEEVEREEAMRALQECRDLLGRVNANVNAKKAA